MSCLCCIYAVGNTVYAGNNTSLLGLPNLATVSLQFLVADNEKSCLFTETEISVCVQSKSLDSSFGGVMSGNATVARHSWHSLPM